MMNKKKLHAAASWDAIPVMGTDTQEGGNLTFDNTYAGGEFQRLQVEGSTEQVTTTGAQLLDRSNPTGSGVGNATITKTGVELTGGGYIYFNKFPLTAGTSVHLSYKVEGNSPRGYVEYFNSDDERISGETLYATGTRTAPENTVTARYYLYPSSSQEYPVTLTNMMLQYGTTATDYEPYTGGQPSPSPDYPQELIPRTVDVIVMDPNGEEMQEDSRELYEGQVADYAKGVETDSYKLVKLTSDMNWKRNQTSARTIFYLENIVCKSAEAYNPTSKSNRFKFIPTTATFASYINLASWFQSQLCFRVDGITDVDSFKTWLDEHETFVLYPLTTPETKTIPKMTEYQGQTEVIINPDETVTATTLLGGA